MGVENIIPWVISLASLTIMFLNYIGNLDKDKQKRVKSETQLFDGIRESLLKVNMKLDQVCSTTNETRSDIKSMNIKIQNLDTEIEIIKRDLKTAFSLIDELKEKV